MDVKPPPLDIVPPDALPALRWQLHVKRLDLFGSAADGRFEPARGDPDFLVTFGEPPHVSDARPCFGFLEGLVIDMAERSTLSLSGQSKTPVADAI